MFLKSFVPYCIQCDLCIVGRSNFLESKLRNVPDEAGVEVVVPWPQVPMGREGHAAVVPIQRIRPRWFPSSGSGRGGSHPADQAAVVLIEQRIRTRWFSSS